MLVGMLFLILLTFFASGGGGDGNDDGPQGVSGVVLISGSLVRKHTKRRGMGTF